MQPPRCVPPAGRSLTTPIRGNLSGWWNPARSGAVLRAQAPAAAGLTAVAGLVVAGMLAAKKRWGLSALIAAAGALAVAPATKVRHVPFGQTETGTAMKVVSYNLGRHQRGSSGRLKELTRLGGDIVVVVEASAGHLHDIGNVLPEHRSYVVLADRSGPASVIIASKWPITNVRRGHGRNIRAVIDVNGTELVVWGVHPTSPSIAHGTQAWRDAHDGLREHLETEPAGPMIVAGDWNATTYHSQLRETLRRAGLQLTRHPLAGSTWHHRALGWLAGLDHIAVKGNIALLASGTGKDGGSDHRPVWATLSLQPN